MLKDLYEKWHEGRRTGSMDTSLYGFPVVADSALPTDRAAPTRLDPITGLDSKRFVDVERAKGLAIILVVLGHFSSDAPPGNEWYEQLKVALYQFHMPFFMCLSGITMFLSYKENHTFAGYFKYMRRRFTRLMLPFLVFGVLLMYGKEFAATFIPLDHVYPDLAHGAWLLVTKPIKSSVGFLWYIYTLFLFYAVMPWLMRLGKKNLGGLLLLSAALHFLPLEQSIADWFMFSEFAQYLLYLVIGFCIVRFYEEWIQIIDRHSVWFVTGFLFLLLYFELGSSMMIASKTVLGVASIPALHALVRGPWGERTPWLALLGGYSFTIYLLNVPVTALIRGVAERADLWGGPQFPLLSVAMLFCGVLVPIVLSKQVFHRFPWLDRITR
jgi:fucose 4-O-acetylase-like acetyltransferase